MDPLIEASLNAAALRSERCERHPDREGRLAIDLPSIGIKRYWCQECRDAYDAMFPAKGFGRAFGTGTGAQAHAEAQESGRYDREYQDLKPHAKVRKYHD